MIVVVGSYILFKTSMREKFDLKIYVECPDDIRLAQRVEDYMTNYNYDLVYVINQYIENAKPAFEEVIEKTKILADFIVPNQGSKSISN